MVFGVHGRPEDKQYSPGMRAGGTKCSGKVLAGRYLRFSSRNSEMLENNTRCAAWVWK
jgi:hypothetical protein